MNSLERFYICNFLILYFKMKKKTQGKERKSQNQISLRETIIENP